MKATITEPLAAGMVYLDQLRTLTPSEHAIVIHFGTSSLNISLLRMVEGLPELVASDGDLQFGSSTFDEALREFWPSSWMCSPPSSPLLVGTSSMHMELLGCSLLCCFRTMPRCQCLLSLSVCGGGPKTCVFHVQLLQPLAACSVFAHTPVSESDFWVLASLTLAMCVLPCTPATLWACYSEASVSTFDRTVERCNDCWISVSVQKSTWVSVVYTPWRSKP